MNEKAEKYWNELWKGKEKPGPVDAWQFGDTPDELAQLVIQGKKTTTTGAHMIYELKNKPLPVVGQYSIILNGNDEPVAVIKVIDVQVMPMNQVSEKHTAGEGDCDEGYEFWWDLHKEFFSKGLAKFGKEFSEDMLVVCKEFELFDVKQ